MKRNVSFFVLLAASESFLMAAPTTRAMDSQDCVCELLEKPNVFHKEETSRWMVHSLDWGVLSTISTRLSIRDQDGTMMRHRINEQDEGTGGKDGQNGIPVPFGNVYSFVDGPCDNSTGIPYIYGTYMDQSFLDILDNAAVSLTLSEASIATARSPGSVKAACSTTMGHGGHDASFGDPENPMCARLTLTGTLQVLDSPGQEYEFAKDALFERHASMKDWPADHDWIVAKVDIRDIWLIDFFGGASILDVDAYMNVELTPPVGVPVD